MYKVVVTTFDKLSAKQLKYIRDNMTWGRGGLHDSLAAQDWRRVDKKIAFSAYEFVALVFDKEKIVNWTAIRKFKNNFELNSWTLEHYRRKGLMRLATAKLIRTKNLPKQKPILVYSHKVKKMLDSFGIKSWRVC